MRALHGRERGVERLSAAEVDGIDVVLIVPEVERRLDGARSPARGKEEAVGVLAGVVVRLVRVARRQGARESLDRRRSVESTPARVRIAPGRARRAARLRLRVGGRALDDRRHLLGPQQGPDAEQVRRDRRRLRRGERRPLRGPELRGRTRGVPLVRAARSLPGERARERRENVLSGSPHVVVDGVPIRERGRPPASRQGADAEHVGESRRVAREAPRRPGSLVGVADRGHDHRAVLHGVSDRLLLEARVRVATRVPRVAKAAQADVDDACTVVDRPADRTRLRLDGDRPVGCHDLRDDELGRGREPGDPDVVVELRGDDPRNDRPVAAAVLRAAADEALRHSHVPGEIRMAEVDARVDHGDADRRERRRCLPCVVGAVGERVPLPRRQRVRRDERDPPDAIALDPGDAREAAQTVGGRVDGEGMEPREARRARTGHPLDRRGDSGGIGVWIEADGRGRGLRRRRQQERGTDGKRPKKGAEGHAATRTVSGGPARPSAESR